LMAGGWVGKFGSSDGQYTRITRLMRTILASRGWIDMQEEGNSCSHVRHDVMKDQNLVTHAS
jgi:hypothetical protein